MQKSHIGDECLLDNVIADKDVKVEQSAVIKGSALLPYILRKRTIQGALMNS
jgi:glucose-1-phosphate adenylyltransferase